MLKFIHNDKLRINKIDVGYITYYIIELDKEEKLVNNKLIKKLFTLNIPLYWFRSYYEFETFFLVFNPKQDINFILIG
ncbi:MAG: hypothetical protein PUH11_08125 [Bacilli bacterium]|nr:hypothetical protein [Bacilli bacterium]MDD7315676.1 hypothetical protein [Bacilli bacterium]MDY4053011.1 hypothetical protein [Bacilli bacterium]